MRIGIDIKCLKYNNSGIGRYLRSLLDALQNLDQENEYVLFSPAKTSYQIFNPKWKFCEIPPRFKIPGILWQQFVLPKAVRTERIRIFWGPEQTLFLKRIPGVARFLTVHDFVYKRYPETMRRSVLWINRIFGSLSILTADKILCDSNFTKHELEHFFPNVRKEISLTVPCGSSLGQSSSEKIFGSRKEQLLFVGNQEPRKNLENLILALEILAKKNLQIPLILVGAKGWKNKRLAALMRHSPVRKNVHQLGFVSEEKLRELYATSAAVVFPSFYEGFGLPVLEALEFRTPILTSQNSVMQDIAGDVAFYFDPKSPDSIAKVLENFWTSPAKRTFLKSREQNVQKILEKYSWENSAKRILQEFEQMNSQNSEGNR